MTLELSSSHQRHPTKGRIWLAWAIAAAADALQVGGFAFFSEGFASPLDVGLDVVVGISLVLLLGWHIAFIPTFIIEALPFADLAPTWTLAVFLATRGKNAKSELPLAK